MRLRKITIDSILFVLVFISIAFPGVYADAVENETEQENSVVLKVMSINLRHNSDYWEERFPLIADEIVRLAPDLIGMQEVEIGINQSRVLKRLISEKSGGALDYELYEHLKTGGSFISGEGVSIFSRYPILKSDFADLEYGRPVLIARVKISGDLGVDLYNTHLHHRGGDEVRLPQAEKIAAFIEKRDAGLITFLTGDLNSRPGSETISFIQSLGFIDSFRAVHPDEKSVPGFTSPVILSKDNAIQNPVHRIDYVYFKPGTAGRKITVLDSVVCFKNHNEEGLYPSDHLGVMSTFEIQY